MNPQDEKVIEVRGLVSRFGDTVVHDRIDLEVRRGEIFGLVGGSGSGKSVLLRTLLLLIRPAEGEVDLLGQGTDVMDSSTLNQLRRRLGILFQQGALFSSLSVLDNIAFPLREYTELSSAAIVDIARLKLDLSGLPPETAAKFPRELSGGMLKRAALARAIAMDPELLFLDEPTAGLDPVSANAFDELLLKLKHDLGLTVVMVTHDLDSLWRVTDRVAFLGNKRILALSPMAELSESSDPMIAEYFSGPRGRAAGSEHRGTRSSVSGAGRGD